MSLWFVSDNNGTKSFPVWLIWLIEGISLYKDRINI